MQRLRFITTALVVFAALVVLSYPLSVGPMPSKEGPKSVRREYAVRLMTFATVASIAWFAAGLSAYFLSKRIRADYEKEVVQNIADLVTSIPTKKQDHDDAT